jgi:hypothetical protein
VLRWLISALVAVAAGAGAFAGLAVQGVSASQPVLWVAVGSAAALSLPSTYAALGGLPARAQPDPAVWRRQLIGVVRRVWIAGTLRSPDSLPVIAGRLIPLGLVVRPDLVARAGRKLADPRPRPLPPGRSLGGLFEDSGRSLLLVGPPGGGKTTLLLGLAESLLVAAERAGGEPVPAVFTLASWAERRGPLASWLADRFARDYQVPKRVGREWVELGSVVVLLDGLDEVPGEHRRACVAAINEFRRGHPGTAVVVCGRTAECAATPTRLELNCAVEIAALDGPAVERFLTAAGPALIEVRRLLSGDRLLREVVDSPFLLNIAALTCRTAAAGQAGGPASVDRRRHALLEDYLQLALRRWAPASPVPAEIRLRWLRWLAGAMRGSNQPVLHLLWMQPRLVEPAGRAGSVVAAAAGLCGLGGLALSGLLGAVLAHLPYEVPIDIPRPVLYPLSVVFVTAATVSAGYSRLFAPPLWVHWTAANLAAELPRRAAVLTATTLLVGVLFTGIGGAAAGAVAGTTFGVILTLALTIRSTLHALSREESQDGRCLTGRHLLRVAARGGLPFGLVVGAVYGTVAAVAFRPAVGLGQGAAVAAAFWAFGTYFLWLAIGGRAYLQHLALRVALARQGNLPWRLRRFLDDLVTSTLLRRQGTGYAFIHDLVHAHVLGEPDTLAAPGVPAPAHHPRPVPVGRPDGGRGILAG